VKTAASGICHREISVLEGGLPLDEVNEAFDRMRKGEAARQGSVFD